MPALPNPNRRRANAPTIPTRALPAGGRTAPAPRVPAFARLGTAGKAWWRWAWKTPQAAAWAGGHEGIVARRASLEDDLAALEAVEGLDFLDVLGADRAGEVKTAIIRLAALAGNRLSILREIRELEDRLGLSPKGMAQLHWEIVATAPTEDQDTARDEVTSRRAERRARLAG